MKTRYAIAAAWLVFAPALMAAAKPSADEVNKILEFYDNGYQLGPVIAEAKLCNDVSREGDEKNNCSSVIDGNSLSVNQNAYVWLKMIVPKGVSREKLIVQFNYNDVTRKVREVNVNAGFRFRTWTKFALDREGSWTVRVMYDNGTDVKQMAEIPVTITSDTAAKR